MDVCSFVYRILLYASVVFSKPTLKKDRVQRHKDNQSYRYDHEAFLGKEEATTFDELTPEESKERLGNIVDRIDANPEQFEDATDQFSFKKMLPRDEMRFNAANLDSDREASREEFTAFLHPEEFEHMKDIVVLRICLRMKRGVQNRTGSGQNGISS
ncbi:hypothetical protein AAFF_G00382640, partial [Aldrovandia affinis]